MTVRMGRAAHRVPQCWAEVRILAVAAVNLACVAVWLRWASLNALARWAQPPVGPGRLAPTPGRITYLVNGVANCMPLHFSCLARSLVLARMLRMRGSGCVFVVGVRMETGHFSAHAWVECNGMPVNESVEVAGRFSKIAAGDRLAADLFGRA